MNLLFNLLPNVICFLLNRKDDLFKIGSDISLLKEDILGIT